MRNERTENPCASSSRRLFCRITRGLFRRLFVLPDETPRILFAGDRLFPYRDEDGTPLIIIDGDMYRVTTEKGKNAIINNVMSTLVIAGAVMLFVQIPAVLYLGTFIPAHPNAKFVYTPYTLIVIFVTMLAVHWLRRSSLRRTLMRHARHIALPDRGTARKLRNLRIAIGLRMRSWREYLIAAGIVMLIIGLQSYYDAILRPYIHLSPVHEWAPALHRLVMTGLLALIVSACAMSFLWWRCRECHGLSEGMFLDMPEADKERHSGPPRR